MSSQYVCPLDAETQKKALDELYEDPKNRQGAIDTFRDWIKQQKHIKCPLGKHHMILYFFLICIDIFGEYSEQIGGPSYNSLITC